MKFERKQAVSHTFQNIFWAVFLVGANTPPGSDVDFSILADVKHLFMRHNSRKQREKSKKRYITPLSDPLSNPTVVIQKGAYINVSKQLFLFTVY